LIGLVVLAPEIFRIPILMASVVPFDSVQEYEPGSEPVAVFVHRKSEGLFPLAAFVNCWVHPVGGVHDPEEPLEIAINKLPEEILVGAVTLNVFVPVRPLFPVLVETILGLKPPADTAVLDKSARPVPMVSGIINLPRRPEPY
jgi:hypothetical protein